MVQETRNAPVGGAIALILLGVMGGLGLDLCAKAILETYPLEQFVFLRSLLGLLLYQPNTLLESLHCLRGVGT